METYAVISLGGKQYRVREGERLRVERLPYEEGKTFHPDVLLVGGAGEALVGKDELKGQQVIAKVAAHVLGQKVVIGKYRKRTGYKRKNGHRSRLSEIEIQSIGKKASRPAKKAEVGATHASPEKTEEATEGDD
jgi:large subunit ribosomal protein L21